MHFNFCTFLLAFFAQISGESFSKDFLAAKSTRRRAKTFAKISLEFFSDLKFDPVVVAALESYCQVRFLA